MVSVAVASFTFRAVSPRDFDLLREWHRRPHVLQWWSEPPAEQDLLGYCVSGTTRASRFYMALLDGDPIGFVQCYSPVEGHAEGWWLEEHDPDVRGIDQYLANADQLSLGLGTQMIRAFASMLFEDPRVTRIQVDPDPGNGRAIRCYEKAGFRRIREISTPDGPAALMYLERTKPS